MGCTRALRLCPLCPKSPVCAASLLFFASSLKENDYSSKSPSVVVSDGRRWMRPRNDACLDSAC